MKAMQAMTRSVVCVREQDTIEAARDIMREWNIRHLVVVRDRKLVGVVSDRDILLHAEGGTSSEPEVSDKLVGEIMTPRPITCSPTDTISHIAGLMIENKIDCLPVVDIGEFEVAGLITSTDLLELLREREIRDTAKTVPWSYAVRLYGPDGASYT